MVTLRCTRKSLERLQRDPVVEPAPSTTILGDWYANVISTVAGELVVCANERTLLSVAFPTELLSDLDIALIFRTRVYNLLSMLDVPVDVAQYEHRELRPLQFATTASRSVVGSLNEISRFYQFFAERAPAGKPLSLSEAELNLSTYLHGPLDYEYPADVARQLFSAHVGEATNE